MKISGKSPPGHKTVHPLSEGGGPALPASTRRIMLVDDSKTFVEFLKLLLASSGCDLKVYTNSVEAFEAFRGDPDLIDMVITDLTMPNITGIELAQKVLDIRPDMPIIMCSASIRTEDERRAKSVGIREYMGKSRAIHDLAVTVQRLLNTKGTAPSE